jgi:hypothetical protein
MVTITGRGWQANETVWMLLHEEPETREDTILSSMADSQGNFTNTDFAPSLLDINRNFTLTAIGQLSSFTAQTAFKDAPRIASVTVGSQTGTLTYGTVGSATFAVTPVRGNNGTVNGTLSVISGLPAGVTASFSPNPPNGAFTANGNSAFPTGTATASAIFTGDANHNGSSDSKNFAIDKAGSITTVSCPANVTYTGSALEPCTATVTGAGGLNQPLAVNYTNNINA